MTDNYIIDPEFQSLLPAHDADTLARLEEKLLAEGCLDPIRVWRQENIVVDGMTRITICRKHGIKFRVVEMDFETREEVKRWIVINQFSRRDMKDNTKRKYFLGQIYKWRKEENTSSGGTKNVVKELSEETGYSKGAIHRAEKLAEVLDDIETISPELKTAVLDEKVTVTVEVLEEVVKSGKKKGKTKAKSILAGKPTNLSESDESPTIYDSLGNVVADVWLHEVFVDVVTYHELIREGKTWESKLRRLAQTAAGVTLHANELKVTQIIDELKARIPWCKCLTCLGSKALIIDDKRCECPDCSGLGFMTSVAYDRKENKRKKK